MKEPSLGIITPSYFKDFDRCKLLCESIKHFAKNPINHYIVVDGQDLSLFKPLENSHTFVLTKEFLLPWWVKKIPFLKQNIWLSLKTLPVRGWIVQQVIKISTAHHIQEDILVFADSDVCFVREFDVSMFMNAEKVRFYRKPNCIAANMKQGHKLWYQNAAQLLNCPDVEFPANDYINQLVTWRRDNVLKLCERIEIVSGRNWVQTLFNCWNFSEYILYGVFIDSFLQENSGHYFEENDITHNYYLEDKLSKEQIKEMVKVMPEDRIAVMLSAKAEIPVSDYRQYIFSS